MDSTGNLKSMIEAHYDIGYISQIDIIVGGTVNTSYCVWTEIDSKIKKYVLRQYQPKKNQNDIEFEHAIIDHLGKKNFSIVGYIKPTKSNKTYFVTYDETSDNPPGKVFNSMFSFLEGEDLYSWYFPGCSFDELMSSAQTLAEYHSNISDFRNDKTKSDLTIKKLLPTLTKKIDNYINNSDITSVTVYLKAHLNLINKEINDVSRAFNALTSDKFPEVVIHCDFHPGNLLYKNGIVTGMFDFDWALFDIRAFDVGMALMYFCAEWNDTENGSIHQSKVDIFTKNYQERFLKSSNNKVGPLNNTELNALQLMIRSANLFLLYWGIIDFYTKSLDPTEYIKYVEHSILMIKWLRTNTLHFSGA
jgi:homoserine kinase type II